MCQEDMSIRSNKCWGFNAPHRNEVNMKKKIILRSLLGMPIGITISYLITVLISVFIADGNYYPVVPELVDACGSEINAVLIQTLFSFLYGAVWGGASVIWEMEGWSLLRMTATHLGVCSIATFPVAYFSQWMPHSFAGFLRYFGAFFAIYLMIWFSQYQSMKKKINQINHKVRQQ